MTEHIIWFENLSRTHTQLAGGKGANLGEMTRAGLPVPAGFVLSSEAFLAALDAADIRKKLADRFAFLNADDSATLRSVSEEMQRLVLQMKLPSSLESEIVRAYQVMGHGEPVAVRSSATSEDTATTSFAGMHETYTNVVGETALLEKN